MIDNTIDKKRVMFGNGKRDYSVDMMRCISCFMVVVTHMCSYLVSRCPYDETIGVTTDWLTLTTMKCTVVSATNLFLMISGIFFLSPERNVSISKVWSKNLFKLAMAYIVWSILYALMRIYYLNPRPFSWELLFDEAVIQEFHLWYIPMMIGIYVLVPLMRVFTAHAERKHYLYMIGLMIGAMLLNSVLAFNGVYEYESVDKVNIIISRTPTELICQYPFYCILGYYLYTYRPKIKTRVLLYFLGIAGIVFMVWVTTFFYVETGNVNQDALHGKFTIGVLAKNTALFVFVITAFSKVRMLSWFKKALLKLSNATLFIYLSHIFFRHIITHEEWLLNGDLSLPVIAIVYALVIYFGAFLFSLLFLQSIPWVRMRNAILDVIWPNRTIWNGGRK